MRRLPRVLLLAEVGDGIGTGHLKEAARVTAALRRLGGGASLWSLGVPPPGMEVGVAGRLRNGDPKSLSAWAQSARRRGVRTVLLDLWDSTAAQHRAIADEGLALVVIDERGGKRIYADAVVNPLLLPSRHRYGGTATRLMGPRYLPMAAGMTKPAATRIGPARRVLLTFGGIDRTAATPVALTALLTARPEAIARVILGPGYRHHAALENALRRFPRAQVEILRAVPDLKPHIVWSDIVVSAGGNTLCEAAALGRPALVAHEDPHEREHGRAFATRGFGICLGRGTTLRASPLRSALRRLDDPAVRRRMSKAGRAVVDGRGADRLAALLVKLAESIVVKSRLA